MGRFELNPTDLKVLHLIAAANAQQKPSPSILELCAATGMVKSGVRYRLERLVRLRYLLPRGRYRWRTLHIHPERIAIEKRRGDAIRMYYMIT